MNSCEFLQRSIEQTELLVTIQLDLMRNRLLRLNVVFGIITVS